MDSLLMKLGRFALVSLFVSVNAVNGNVGVVPMRRAAWHCRITKPKGMKMSTGDV
jgi:hypothetical protein